MEKALPLPRWRPTLRPWPIAVVLAVALPLGLLGYVLTSPASEVRLDDPVRHFALTTNVSLIAGAVALLVARGAIRTGHLPTLLVSLGFMSLAGTFAVRGLATPGVLLSGESQEVASRVVVALSAQVGLLVPASFFAASWSPLVRWLDRLRAFAPALLIGSLALGIFAYGAIALTAPRQASEILATLVSYWWVGAVTIFLFLYAAIRQAREFVRSRLPTHGAMVIAFLLFAQTQVAAMVLGATFPTVFWEYDGLVATATILALGALFLELDRRRGLERFLAPHVVERVMAGEKLSTAGERRTATILFTDLRGSTALAERVPPEVAVATINAYLRPMARAVMDEGGILDKFTGDGLMAIFGAMSDPATGANAAARAALRMRRDIAALTAERGARGEPTMGYGVGIHTGEVVLGAVGLPERSDYTAMGDAVNTAARMESLTKELGADIVVSSSTALRLAAEFRTRSLGEATVRGKSAPIAIVALA